MPEGRDVWESREGNAPMIVTSRNGGQVETEEGVQRLQQAKITRTETSGGAGNDRRRSMDSISFAVLFRMKRVMSDRKVSY